MATDPRMLAQAAALRGQGGPTGIGPAPPPGMPPGGMPGVAPPPGGPPQSGLAMQGQGINSGGIPQGLQPGAANLVAGMPQAQERFSQGQRQGDQADQLRADTNEAPMGKMVGRVYVPAAITQHGAHLMKAFVARQKEKQQAEERRGASEEMSMLRSGFLSSLKGQGPSEEDDQ